MGHILAQACENHQLNWPTAMVIIAGFAALVIIVWKFIHG